MLYVAYGSNLNINQMAFRCPDAKLIGTGMIHGYRLVFKYHVDIIQDTKSSVPVLVWDVSQDDIAALDMYEGYPKYYTTKDIDVEMDNGQIVHAFVYVMQPNYGTIEPPSNSYFSVIEDGYIENNMDLDYLYDAEKESFYECVK